MSKALWDTALEASQVSSCVLPIAQLSPPLGEVTVRVNAHDPPVAVQPEAVQE
jgi:hypothetical protein